MVANLTTRLGQLTSSPAGGPYTGANKIINGDMVISQRYAAASTAAFGGYTLDRWTSSGSGAAMTGTVQQNAGSVTPPTGLTYYLGFTSTAAHAMAAGDFARLIQPIEGLNCTDLNWGTASARSITISFYLYSSITGSHGCCVQNNAGNRSYPFTVSIPVANTWTYCTTTIPGDTTGTWLTTNGVGLYLQLAQGCGTTYSGTANAWAAANLISVTGAVNVTGTNGATYYVTGVKVETGSVATPFVPDDYQVSLGKCWRYFQTYTDPQFVGWFSAASTASRCGMPLTVTMRATPTAAIASGTQYIHDATQGGVVLSIATAYLSNQRAQFDLNTSGGYTATRVAVCYANASVGNAVWQFTAEL